MSQIDPMYQFSLDVYISLFVLSIEKSPKCQNFEDRIMALTDYHTYSVYRYSENLIKKCTGTVNDVLVNFVYMA